MAMVVPQAVAVASIGIPDTLFLMLLALVVFGPRRLPEIGRQIGKLMYEFRKVSNDFKFQMEEELRASEEADRLAKLAATPAPPITSQATLDVPPHPVSEIAEGAPLEIGSGSGESAAVESDTASSVEGEVRGEPRRFPPAVPPTPSSEYPQIQPPSTGDPIAAQKPFRGRVAETPTESGDAPERVVETPVVVADEGRVGSEVQPGVNKETATESGQEVHHG
jgi:sec-independent protein translocase protein TatB